jgi:WD40 repeat protein
VLWESHLKCPYFIRNAYLRRIIISSSLVHMPELFEQSVIGFWTYWLSTCSFCHVTVGEGSGPGERGMRHWIRRTNLVDSRTSVTDIKFAPKSLGLLLATCSADGVVRIYEAPDVMNLSQWTLQHELSCKLPCSCLSWNPSFSRSEEVLY